MMNYGRDRGVGRPLGVGLLRLGGGSPVGVDVAVAVAVAVGVIEAVAVGVAVGILITREKRPITPVPPPIIVP